MQARTHMGSGSGPHPSLVTYSRLQKVGIWMWDDFGCFCLLSLVWTWRIFIFQLSGFNCTVIMIVPVVVIGHYKWVGSLTSNMGKGYAKGFEKGLFWYMVYNGYIGIPDQGLFLRAHGDDLCLPLGAETEGPYFGKASLYPVPKSELPKIKGPDMDPKK